MLVTSALADELGASPGDRLSLTVGESALNARVAGVVPYLPSVTGSRAVLADRTTLGAALLAVDGLGTLTDRWWVNGLPDPPTPDHAPQEGLMNIRDFAVHGEPALDRIASQGANGAKAGVDFSRLRVEFTRGPGKVAFREGVLRGPTIGATMDGNIDYAKNEVHMRGTFVPLYGLNNAFGQIPIVGLFLGGSNEGLIGVTYEVVGTPGAPVLRVNPISAMAPGVLRKIFDFNTGKQQSLPPDFQSMQ